MLIKKNGEVMDVTKGAFRELFKDAGWKQTKDKPTQKKSSNMTPKPKEGKKPEQVEIPFANVLNEEPEEEIEEDYKLVLEDMTVKELIEYAAENDIDLEGKTRKDDIIAAIEEELEEE